MKTAAKTPEIRILLNQWRRRGAQLSDCLRDIIAHGRLLRGVRLPSSRTLARQLGVSRNTVLAAYDELIAEGLLSGRVGAGTCVDHDSRELHVSDPDELILVCVDLHTPTPTPRRGNHETHSA